MTSLKEQVRLLQDIAYYKRKKKQITAKLDKLERKAAKLFKTKGLNKNGT